MITLSYEKILPRELWQMVLADVTPGDLCNVTRTSSQMNDMASWPELWKGMKVNVKKVRENGLPELYSIKRFKKITKIDLSGMDFTSEELSRLLTDIPESPLKNVDLSNVAFVNVIRLKTIGETRLRKKVPAELLASSISSLQTINLGNAQLTSDQAVKILEASLSCRTLINLTLGGVNLKRVKSGLLAKAVSRLQTVNLAETNLITKQIVFMLKTSLSSTTLVSLNLEKIRLGEVPAELLAEAVSRLQIVNMNDTNLKTDQCVKILKASISSNTLVNVDLGNINLSEIPAKLLAKAVSLLQTVYLNDTNLSTDQCVQILEAIQSSKTLLTVVLASVNLSQVPSELLAKAVSLLQSVVLRFTNLTSDQCVKVLIAVLSSKTLIKVDLSVVNFKQKVPADLLASLPSYVSL